MTIDEWLEVHPARTASAKHYDGQTHVTLIDERRISFFAPGYTRAEAEVRALREYERRAITEQARTVAR